jgi:PAS domain S-box-containing protein
MSDQLELIFQRVSDLLFLLAVESGPRFRVLTVNPSLLHITGFTEAQVVGHTIEEIFPPEEAAEVLTHYHAALQSHESLTYEEERRLPTGRFAFETTLTPIWNEDGQCTQILGTSHDITARKRAEEALRASQQQYARLVHSIEGILWECDPQRFRFVFVSQEAERLLGYPLEQWLTDSTFWPNHIHPDDREWVLASCLQAIQERHNHVMEYRMVAADGRVVWLRDIITAIVDQEQTVRLRGVMIDITQEKHLQAELVQAKDAAEAANRAKSEFLATMSHELRTPLGIILGYTEMLLEEPKEQLPMAPRKILERIDHNAHELLELIIAALDLSRLEAGRLPVDVRTVEVADLFTNIQAEVHTLQEHSPLTFRWDIAENLPALRTDPKQFTLVINNLIRNAIKFTPEGSITVAAKAHAEGVEICVTDTGIGIPADALALIFEPFRQVEHPHNAHPGGTGLGLYIVRRLLGVLGGTVTVESTVGQGSTFRVWMPKG